MWALSAERGAPNTSRDGGAPAQCRPACPRRAARREGRPHQAGAALAAAATRRAWPLPERPLTNAARCESPQPRHARAPRCQPRHLAQPQCDPSSWADASSRGGRGPPRHATMNLSQLPAFVLSVIVLWWSPTIGCFLNAVQFYKLVGKRNDAFKWCVQSSGRGRFPAPRSCCRGAAASSPGSPIARAWRGAAGRGAGAWLLAVESGSARRDRAGRGSWCTTLG
jgi:hypothetical protein